MVIVSVKNLSHVMDTILSCKERMIIPATYLTGDKPTKANYPVPAIQYEIHLNPDRVVICSWYHASYTYLVFR